MIDNFFVPYFTMPAILPKLLSMTLYCKFIGFGQLFDEKIRIIQQTIDFLLIFALFANHTNIHGQNG